MPQVVRSQPPLQPVLSVTLEPYEGPRITARRDSEYGASIELDLIGVVTRCIPSELHAWCTHVLEMLNQQDEDWFTHTKP